MTNEPMKSRNLCRCCGKPSEGMTYEEIGKHDWREPEDVKRDGMLEQHLGVDW